MRKGSWLKQMSAIIIIAVLLMLNCALAETIMLPQALKMIGASSFEGDTSLTDVIVASGTQSIGQRAFAASGLKEIVIPSSVTNIESDAFSGCGEINYFVERNSYAYSRIEALLRAGSASGRLCMKLDIGDNVVPVPAGMRLRTEFTATSAGAYHFYSTGSEDTCAVLSDENGSLIAQDEDSGADDNFWIRSQLDAGQKVYLDVYYRSDSVSGDMSVVALREAPLSVGSNSIRVNAGETMRAKLTVPSDGVYDLYSTGSKDTSATLYDESGEMIAYNDDGGEDNNFLISQELSAGSVVYLDVRYYLNYVSGTMNVVVEKEAQSLSLGNNAVSVSAGETVRTQFVAPATNVYYFYSTGRDDTRAALLDANGQQLSSDDDGGEDSNFRIARFLNVGTTVYLDVRYSNNYTSGPMNVVVEQYIQSLSIGSNSVYVDSGATVRTKLSVSSTGIYNIYSTGRYGTRAGLYTALGVLIESDGGDGDNFLISRELSAGTQYYLDVGYDSASVAGSMNVVVERVYQQLTTGSNVVNVNAGETVRTKFIVPSNGTYAFYSTGSRDTYATLYDAGGVQIAFNDEGGDGSNFRIERTLSAGSTVYLDVKYYLATLSGSMTVVVEKTPQVLTLGSNAVDVSAGVTVRTRMTIPASGTYDFYSTGSKDTSAVLYDASGTQIAYNDDGDDGDNFLIRQYLSAGAVVYLDVKYYSATISGTMNVVVEEYFQTLSIGSNAVEVRAGVTVRTKITIPSVGTYNFYSINSGDTRGTLYNSDGVQINYNDDNGSDKNFFMSQSLTAGTVVYLDVRYYSSTMSGMMTVVVEKAMPQLSTGTNQIYVNAGETVRTKLTVPSAGNYSFYSSGSDDTKASLYSASGTLLASDDDSRDGENFLIKQTLTAGAVVYLDVKYYSSSKAGFMTVHVDIGDPQSGVSYRSLLIGQEGFDPICTRNRGDVELMQKVLKTVNDGKYSITTAIDLSKSQVRNAIANTFSDADYDDVSLFFYSSHGVTDAGNFYGALATYDGDCIKTSEIANWLSAIPGKVIVICGTCGSGALIMSGSDAGEIKTFDPVAFDQALIEAFAAADPGILLSGDVANSGELRQNKFYVLTAAAAGENSWGSEALRYNYFAKWLTDGIGTSGSMSADTNRNGQTTLNELYNYVQSYASTTTFTNGAKQHTQVYPTNSSYVLFTR